MKMELAREDARTAGALYEQKAANHKPLRIAQDLLEKEEDGNAADFVRLGDIKSLARAYLAAMEALRGVMRVADRKTVEFDAARAAIAKAEGR